MYISRDVIDILWDAMDDKSWESLEQILETQAGDVRWLRVDTLKLLKMEVNDLRYSGESFPQTPDALELLLNRNAEQFTDAR